jgi:lipid II:glycine glycyltransferase (peptidoglycan interpeptide bridge formation enzyme)
MIVCGRGDLVLGHYAGDLVAGTMVMDGGDTAYYASAVYDRKQFDKPLGHAPLFNAIIRAKRRGLEVFDVGEIPLDADEKEMSIGYFKQGFTSRRQVSHCLSWAPE